MPKLLVSVRDEREAETALGCSVDILDIKEPLRGSLGAADPTTAQRIAKMAVGRVKLSVALGELLEVTRHADPRVDNEWLRHFDFVKAGPAGITDAVHAARVWRIWMTSLPQDVQPVAVAYADWREARTLRPEKMIDCVAGTRVRGLLLDTNRKHSGLFDCLAIRQVENVVKEARQAGLWVALAGSLCTQTIPTAVFMNPDIIAVRGAVCDNGRTGTVRRKRISQVAALVHREPPVDLNQGH